MGFFFRSRIGILFMVILLLYNAVGAASQYFSTSTNSLQSREIVRLQTSFSKIITNTQNSTLTRTTNSSSTSTSRPPSTESQTTTTTFAPPPPKTTSTTTPPPGSFPTTTPTFVPPPPPPPTTTSAGTSPPTNTPETLPPHDFSETERIGVGVGVSIGAIFVFGLLFYVFGGKKVKGDEPETVENPIFKAEAAGMESENKIKDGVLSDSSRNLEGTPVRVRPNLLE